MCSGGKCDKDRQCCADLLKLYCRIYQLYLMCPPVSRGEPPRPVVSLLCLLEHLRVVIEPIFARLQCGRVFCCEGYVEAIFCSFQTAISELSGLTQPPQQGQPTVDEIMEGLRHTLRCIVRQTGFIPAITFPTCPSGPEP